MKKVLSVLVAIVLLMGTAGAMLVSASSLAPVEQFGFGYGTLTVDAAKESAIYHEILAMMIDVIKDIFVAPGLMEADANWNTAVGAATADALNATDPSCGVVAGDTWETAIMKMIGSGADAEYAPAFASFDTFFALYYAEQGETIIPGFIDEYTLGDSLLVAIQKYLAFANVGATGFNPLQGTYFMELTGGDQNLPITTFVPEAGYQTRFAIDINYGSLKWDENGSIYDIPSLQDVGVGTEVPLKVGKNYIQLTAEDFTSYMFVINVTPAQITKFSINGVQGNINQTNKTIDLELPEGTDLSKLSPAIEFIGKTINPAGGAQVNFAGGAVKYTILADDGKETVYTVNVTTPIVRAGDTSSAILVFVVLFAAVGVTLLTSRRARA